MTLNAFECRRIGDGLAEIRIGDLVSRQAVSLVVQLKFPAGAIGTTSRVVFTLIDDGSVLPSTEADCIWNYAADADNDRQPRNIIVDREVATLHAAVAREEALALNRIGRFDEAQRRLEITVERIRAAAESDPVMDEIVDELSERHGVYGATLSGAAMKSERYASYHMVRMRTAEGKARRGPDSQ
jgi:hypothetical protein